jgi:phage shock protein A
MSRIWGIVVGLCAVVGVGAIIFHFSGARGDVAKKKIIGQIDKWLGESDVQRAEIDRGIKGMDEAVEKLNTQAVKAQVQAERLGREVNVNKKKLDDSKASLAKLGADLKKFDTETNYSVSYGTKTYNKKSELEAMATKVIDYHKTLQKETEAQEQRLKTYEDMAATLTSQRDEAKKKRDELKIRLKDLDAKIEMAKAQKEAAEALNESTSSFADSIKGIEDKINKLSDSTETATRIEDAKWKDLSAKTNVEDATTIIKNAKGTADEIDALLKGDH